jgi:hypothetical protein
MTLARSADIAFPKEYAGLKLLRSKLGNGDAKIEVTALEATWNVRKLEGADDQPEARGGCAEPI